MKSNTPYKFKKGDKVKTREGNIETVVKINSNGNVETSEGDYSWPPDTLTKITENKRLPTKRDIMIVEDFVKKTTKTMINEAKLYLLDASDVKAGNKMVQALSQVSGISMMTNDKTLKQFEYKISRLRMDIMEYIEENSDVKYTASGNSTWKLIKK